MLVAVTLKKQKYYIETESSIENPVIYDGTKKLLGLKDVQKRNFKNMSELWHCLNLIISKTQVPMCLNKDQFLDVCVENLESRGCRLNHEFFKNYVHGCNYSIVKTTDYASIIDLLTVVKSNCFKAKIPVEFRFKTFDLCAPVKKVPSKISKWLCMPYGQISKTNLRVIPLLYDHVLISLYSEKTTN